MPIVLDGSRLAILHNMGSTPEAELPSPTRQSLMALIDLLTAVQQESLEEFSSALQAAVIEAGYTTFVVAETEVPEISMESTWSAVPYLSKSYQGGVPYGEPDYGVWSNPVASWIGGIGYYVNLFIESPLGPDVFPDFQIEVFGYYGAISTRRKVPMRSGPVSRIINLNTGELEALLQDFRDISPDGVEGALTLDANGHRISHVAPDGTSSSIKLRS